MTDTSKGPGRVHDSSALPHRTSESAPRASGEGRSFSGIGSGLFTYHHPRFSAPCNLGCFFCYEQPRSKVMADPADISKDLSQARRAGYRRVVFASGELLLIEGWEQVIRTAVDLGFEERLLLTNLTLIDEENLRDLLAAGISGIAGTLFACSDDEGYSLTGRRLVHTRQLEALRLLASIPGSMCGAHLLLTREALPDPWNRISELLSLLPHRFSHIILSAIEPISPSVAEHPSFVFGHEISWPTLLERADEAGERLVVQNVPACRLGLWAHRSFAIRKRIARIIEGLPRDPALARWVTQNEVLHSRLAATGECARCRLLPVCHRFFEYPVVDGESEMNDAEVIARLIQEEGLETDPDGLLDELRRMALRLSAGAGTE